MAGYFSNLLKKWLKTQQEKDRITQLKEHIEYSQNVIADPKKGELFAQDARADLERDQKELSEIKERIFRRRLNALFGK